MQHSPLIDGHFLELADAIERMRPHFGAIRRWGHTLAMRLSSGGRLLVCGNGGSAAEAQHLTAELIGRFERDRHALSAIALHADTSALTAVVNDYGADEMFARGVRAHGREGDILLSLSTSGSSTNVLSAVKAAHECGLSSWALTGRAPNPLASMCDDAIVVDSESTSTVQELHLTVIHALCMAMDQALLGPSW